MTGNLAGPNDRLLANPLAVHARQCRTWNRYIDCRELDAGCLPSGVRVWSVSVAETRRLPERFACLSDQEMARALHYRKSVDRERFLTARALLRRVLTRVVGGQVPPAQWRFGEGPAGKPRMAPALPALEFNLSHADDCIAVAVSSHPVGVDVERLTPCDGVGPVYDVLTDRERAVLDRQPDPQSAFVRYWTLKEACAKALGLGAALDFRAIEIELDPPRVLISGVLGPGERLDLASLPIWRSRTSYCLSLAKVGSTNGANPVWV
jgi:4'-phosphopantetheinyl transferase